MKKILFLALAVILLVSCGAGGPPDPTTAVPAGEPPFPLFHGMWVIDTTNSLPRESIDQANATLQKLRDENIAEVVIVVVRGVKDGVTWSTRYGRFIKLGGEETNNGLVYLVRPDAAVGERIIYSVGRGLPRFTSAKVTEALDKGAVGAVNSGNYAAGIVALAQGTDEVLRSLYKPIKETRQKDDVTERQSDKSGLLITVVVAVAIWFLIGLVMAFFDFELAMWWWFLGIRILALALTRGAVGGSGTGGGGGFGGRSGSR